MAADDLSIFTRYVNEELPKRVSTAHDPGGLDAGLIPVSTGVGLGVDFIDPNTLVQPGKSAYEVAVDNGFEGTEAEWLASLVGGDFNNLNVGLITATELPLTPEGDAMLPGIAYGGLFLNMAMVHMDDGSVLEVMGATVTDGRVVRLPAEDIALLGEHAVAITVSYLGDRVAPAP